MQLLVTSFLISYLYHPYALVCNYLLHQLIPHFFPTILLLLDAPRQYAQKHPMQYVDPELSHQIIKCTCHCCKDLCCRGELLIQLPLNILIGSRLSTHTQRIYDQWYHFLCHTRYTSLLHFSSNLYQSIVGSFCQHNLHKSIEHLGIPTDYILLACSSTSVMAMMFIH